jgi:hypothetical protein
VLRSPSDPACPATGASDRPGINVGMFLAESIAGILAHSTALFADSIDMLGDAIVYGFSLYRPRDRLAGSRRVAQGNHPGGLWDRHRRPGGREDPSGPDPTVEVMGAVGVLALAAKVFTPDRSPGRIDCQAMGRAVDPAEPE